MYINNLIYKILFFKIVSLFNNHSPSGAQGFLLYYRVSAIQNVGEPELTF